MSVQKMSKEKMSIYTEYVRAKKCMYKKYMCGKCLFRYNIIVSN